MINMFNSGQSQEELGRNAARGLFWFIFVPVFFLIGFVFPPLWIILVVGFYLRRRYKQNGRL
jgi:purine-cytosine permease-like protein